MSTPRDPAERYPDRAAPAPGDTRAVPPVDRDRDGVDDRREAVDRDAVHGRRVDHDRDGVDDRTEAADRRTLVDRDEVIAREREAFGGIKVGAAFFGWLTAVGTATLLTALLAATGAALGLGTEDVDAAADQVGLDAGAIGWIGAIALLVILFVAYYCGGYVAGRMARFNGVKQGIAVWVWALVIAIVVALLGVLIGSQFDIFANLNVFPRIPLSEGDLTVAGIITTILVIVASLGGAILGGKAGTHYHRKVDRAGLTADR
ncbi:YrzE family protein [Agromyces sp. Marseille-P2726]|uniref:YrzE family protein n=1 Tax=Agromyces sp. Marseille-P2726 TaxID=2709132 RepID=UPI0015709213|nr:YrzE family protein [Agromyces sp. Marseille-P2726]